MHYKYIKSSCKYREEDFPNNKMVRCKISEWQVVQGDPDRVTILCLMHDTHLCQFDVK